MTVSAGVAGKRAGLVRRRHICRDGSPSATVSIEIVVAASASDDKSLVLVLEFLKLPLLVLLEVLCARHKALLPSRGLHDGHLLVHVYQRCVLLL